jgi:hypothetical protein
MLFSDAFSLLYLLAQIPKAFSTDVARTLRQTTALLFIAGYDEQSFIAVLELLNKI